MNTPNTINANVTPWVVPALPGLSAVRKARTINPPARG